MTYTGPIPFEEAMAAAKRKQILRTTLPSRELSALDSEVKRRSIFSARLDVFDPLQSLKTNLEKITEGGVDEYGRIRSIPEAKAQLREAMREAGMMPAPSGTREIKDFYSDARRQLMVETNVLDTLNFGRWKATQDQVALDVNPAWELVRMIETRVQRDWQERWLAAAEATGGFDGCTDPREAGGRMVALKNHPIWQALGDGEGGYDDTLGNPWPPFAFNSGMNVIDVSRDDAVALGIMGPDDTVKPSENHDLNESLEASTSRFDAELQTALANDDELEMADGVLRLKNRLQTPCMNRSRARFKNLIAHHNYRRITARLMEAQ